MKFQVLEALSNASSARGPKMNLRHNIVISSLVAWSLISVVVFRSQATESYEGIGLAIHKAPLKMQELRNPFASNPGGEGKAGRKLYKRHCASCHESIPGSDTNAPSLNSQLIHTVPPGYLFWYLKNGNIRRGMPAWSSLPDERLWQLITYLQDVELNRVVASNQTR